MSVLALQVVELFLEDLFLVLEFLVEVLRILVEVLGFVPELEDDLVFVSGKEVRKGRELYSTCLVRIVISFSSFFCWVRS